MTFLGKIWFPAAVALAAIAGPVAMESPVRESFSVELQAPDTVTYPIAGYKLLRRGEMSEVELSDSLLAALRGNFSQEDTSALISARDTMKVPDSLRFTNPFLYKYYIAIKDSLTHIEVRDSLQKSEKSWREQGDSLHARLDSLDWRKLDSLYTLDSAARVKAAFDAWYASLSKDERKRYDFEQLTRKKMRIADSLRAIKEDEKAVRDSIRESVPRILESYVVPDSLKYKRIISWQTDPDFQKVRAAVPDTGYNHYFHDYPFRRRDVQSTWLGVAGSPVQSYNYFERTSDSGVDFYTPNESWTFSHSTLPQYNTKTPYTELAYWGTLLFSTEKKESDNIHILTTQNVTPALNLQFRFDRWGGGGMLNGEETKNKTVAVAGNYLGKRYTAHAGFISNNISRGENGGIMDNYWIRDTTVDSRDIDVASTTATSTIKRRTGFIDQELRIPLTLITSLFHKKDTLSASPADSTLGTDGTTAFIGHSGEWTSYSRTFDETKAINQEYSKVGHLDNKVFMKLQPWKSDAIVSRLNVGVGDKLRDWHETYFDTTRTVSTFRQNSIYAYAGVEGNFHQYFDWDANARFTFAGAEVGDFFVGANARMNFFPFRRARKSPVSLGAHFETSLLEPQRYHQHYYSDSYSWDNNFGKISTTKVRASVDIPWWKLRLDAGYALLAGNIFYDTLGVVRQNTAAMSVLSASLRKEFVIGNFLHLDNRVLLQMSSRPEVMPLPLAAVNLRWFAEFVVQRDKAKVHPVMTMQIGLDGYYNTQWYAPAWNPELGVFQNQKSALYENGPVVDVFVNIQWKRACIFLKFENANMGWPLQHADYFTAHHYIGTQRAFKIGLYWPFYVQPGKHTKNTTQQGGNSGIQDGPARGSMPGLGRPGGGSDSLFNGLDSGSLSY